MADEFMLDEQAQKLEGKLATDQVDQSKVEQKEDDPMQECKMEEDEDQPFSNPEQQVEMTAKAA